MLGKHPRHGPFLKAVSPAAPMRQNLVQLCTEWLRVHKVARTSLLWSLSFWQCPMLTVYLTLCNDVDVLEQSS